MADAHVFFSMGHCLQYKSNQVCSIFSHAVLQKITRSAKNCYKGETGSYQSQLRGILRQCISFLCVFRISYILICRGHIKALMYGWDLYALCALCATKVTFSRRLGRAVWWQHESFYKNVVNHYLKVRNFKIMVKMTSVVFLTYRQIICLKPRQFVGQ